MAQVFTILIFEMALKRKREDCPAHDLSCAVMYNKHDVVIKLLASGVRLDETKSYVGSNILHQASRNIYSDENIMKLLLSGAGVERAINLADDMGRTPLFLATERGKYAIGALLLRRGADPFIVNLNGIYPRDINHYHVLNHYSSLTLGGPRGRSSLQKILTAIMHLPDFALVLEETENVWNVFIPREIINLIIGNGIEIAIAAEGVMIFFLV